MKNSPKTSDSAQNTVTQHASFAETNDLQVSVQPKYLPSHEVAGNSNKKNYFRYDVTLVNKGTSKLQVIRRHWIIIDSEGEKEEVDGPGVVGEYPYLDVDETYNYHSHCAIATSWGTMEGYYKIRREDGTTFNATIARFYLVKN